METEDIIVISDLHIAASSGKGLFQSDEELAGFLKWIYSETRHCSLILNGDVVDFLVARAPKGLIDANESASQAASIIKSHGEVFAALSRLADSPEHQIFILGGNHDPELIFPEVQHEIARKLKPSFTHPAIRWLVNGEALSLFVGPAKVLIEHGDQYDNWNYIDHEALRKLVSLNSRGLDGHGVYKPPPGSYMVINRFNRIRDDFPWVEQLQPLNLKVLSLILELVMPKLERGEQLALWGAAMEFKRMARRAAMNAALRRLKPEAEYWAGEDKEKRLFSDWQAEIEHDNVWGKREPDFARIIKRLRKVSASDSFFDIGKPDDGFRAISRLIELGNHLVIHGHTHAAKAYRVGQGLYLNSGTWAQLMRLPASEASEEEWLEFLRRLDSGKGDSFPRPTFIRVRAYAGATHAELCGWADGAPAIMSAWHFDGNKQEWRQEESNSNVPDSLAIV